MGKKRKENRWMQPPEGAARTAQVKAVSSRGTYALLGNRYSRGFFIEGRKGGQLWQDIFRAVRNENMECSLSLGKIGQPAVLQIICHSLKKQKLIDREIDSRMEKLDALLRVMDASLLPMEPWDRLEWLQMPGSQGAMKAYFLRRGREISDKFVNEIRELSGGTRIVMHMEPVSNDAVQKNMKRLYGRSGGMLEDQNHFTDMSFLAFFMDSPENMAYIDRTLHSICIHYGQEMEALEEAWERQGRILAHFFGTSLEAGKYARCYQTQAIGNLVNL